MFKETHRFYRYRHRSKRGWVAFRVKHKETDLWIRAFRDLEEEALTAVLSVRRRLEVYISEHPEFLKSLVPLAPDPLAPPPIGQMLEASRKSNVGPMAAVAGAVAEAVALALKPFSPLIVVENGGDCYIDVDEELTVGIFAGPDSPFSGKIGLRFAPERFPLGICTSSGTIGHSLSFGKADAVTVVAKDAALADAAATCLGNLVKKPSDIEKALERVPDIAEIEGALIVMKDRMGAWGNLEIRPL